MPHGRNDRSTFQNNFRSQISAATLTAYRQNSSFFDHSNARINNHDVGSDVNIYTSKRLFISINDCNSRGGNMAIAVTGQFAQGQFARGQFAQKLEFFF